MKKILLFIICVLFIIPIWGQENPIISQRLKELYPIVSYENGIYHVFSKDYKHQGLCDNQGKEILPPIYNDIFIGQLHKLGLCTLTKDGKYGVINMQGNFLLPCIYEKAFIHKQNYIDVKLHGKEGLYDLKAKEIIPCIYDEISTFMLEKENYCDVKQNGKVGLYHIKNKTELLPCVFDYISFDEKIGFFKVERNEKKGLYNVEGKEIIPCKYDYLSFKDKIGFFEVKQNEKKGLCNAEGKEIIPCKFDFIWDYNYKETGCFEVELNDKKGVYNDKGKELLQCIYDGVFINSDYIRFSMNEKDGLYSIKENKEVIKPNYNYLSLPSEGLILYQKVKEGKYGYLDVKGNIVIEPQYDNASSFEDGIAQVTKNGVTSILKHPLNGTNLEVSEGSEVWADIDIPQTSTQNEEAFAFIIANENYNHFSGAAYSHNDGKVFAEYCKKTLGLPENNIRYYEDATYGNMANALKQLRDIADVYEGDAKIIFYFSGLGITDEKTSERYILPSDASFSALGSTGYQVNELMDLLNQLKSQYTLLVVDAPFNGNGKDGKPITSGRGVKIANKKVISQDNVVGLIGSEEGNGYSCKQLQHSIMTYSLLEKLKTVKGECCIGDMLEASFQKTREQSLKLFKEVQTPQKVVSEKSNKVLTNKMM